MIFPHYTDKDNDLVKLTCRILTKAQLASDQWQWENWEVRLVWGVGMCIFRAAVQETLLVGLFINRFGGGAEKNARTGWLSKY